MEATIDEHQNRRSSPAGAARRLAPAQTKKALSIEPFDYSTVMTAVQAIFGTQQNIGQGIQAMLTKRIAQDGRFTVVERRKVNEPHEGAGFRRQQSREARHRRARRPDSRRGSDADGRHRRVRPR